MSKEQEYNEVVVIMNIRIPVQDQTQDDWSVCRGMSDQIANAVAERLMSDDLPLAMKDSVILNHDWEMCRQVRVPGMSRNLYTYVLPPVRDLHTAWNEVNRYAYEGQDNRWAEGHTFMAEHIKEGHPNYVGISFHKFPEVSQEFAGMAANKMVTRFIQGASRRVNYLFRREVVKAMEGSFEDGLDVMVAPMEEPF